MATDTLRRGAARRCSPAEYPSARAPVRTATCREPRVPSRAQHTEHTEHRSGPGRTGPAWPARCPPAATMLLAGCLAKLKTEWIPQRYVFALMGMLGMINCYTMRSCLTVAINEMSRPPYKSPTAAAVSDDSCPVETDSDQSSSGDSSTKDYPFDWDSQSIGLILGSFYIGYILTHVPGGVIAGRLGGKHTLGFGILVTTLCTFLTPWACQVGEVAGAVAVRIVMGLGEGVTFPAIYVLLAKWAPKQERNIIGSLVLAGSQMGTLVGNVSSGYLLETFGWITTFYVYGAFGLAWYLFWLILCYSTPDDHPFISDKELQYLNKNVTGAQEGKERERVSTPWAQILTSPPVLALILTEVGHDWGFYTMITDLPKYMSDVQHFKISDNGVLSALPFLCMWISSMVLSALGDLIISKKLICNTTLRKVFTTIGSVGPGAFLLGAAYAGCHRALVVALFCVGMACMGAFYPGMRVNALDLSPRHAGTIGALMNGTGALAGVVAPYIIGLIAPNGLMSEWRIVFGINFAVMAATNVSFVWYGSGELQWWDDPDGSAGAHHTPAESKDQVQEDARA
ncbi:Putative inorganic phosphate cotransporter [Frankliniella fusca]|uniref:Inorganic phosphate cotransporter n=1 Tax=Frankliniella fusca TaxID=407009 RepID=A0AAE1H7P1_9NEOP|nr:Putative inorganic phosphate cotransporter [Frankliniella fusca]